MIVFELIKLIVFVIILLITVFGAPLYVSDKISNKLNLNLIFRIVIYIICLTIWLLHLYYFIYPLI